MKKRLLFLVYDIALHISFVLSIPIVIKKIIFNSKYRIFFKNKSLFLNRIGIGIKQLKIDRSRPAIWIHGASVGEVLLLRPIIDFIKKKSPESFLLLTCSSENGLIVAKKTFPQVDHISYLPLDISYLIRPVVNYINPQLIIISENDVWLNFLDSCKNLKSKLVIINGKLSDRSFKRFLKLKFLAKLIFDNLDLICLQDEHYKNKFLSLNIDEQKLVVTGNIKSSFFNIKLSSSELYERKSTLGLSEEDVVFTLGSTHEDEELMWLEVFHELIQVEPKLKLVIVPRHVNRVGHIKKILNQKGLTYGLWGEEGVFKKHKILLVDVMGELCNIYQMSNYAFVGGTFKEKVGGHNLLEPIFYNIPLFFGPYTFSQSRIAQLIIEKKCGISLPLCGFHSIVIESLKDKKLLSLMVNNGQNLLKEENSSLNITLSKISSFIPC